MVLLTSDELPMLVRVLPMPLIVLFDRVCVALAVMTVSAPTVAVVMLNVPPVTVLPVKVNAAGSETTTVVVPVAVTSLAVPVTDDTAPMPAGVIVTLAAAVSWPWPFTVKDPT